MTGNESTRESAELTTEVSFYYPYTECRLEANHTDVI